MSTILNCGGWQLPKPFKLGRIIEGFEVVVGQRSLTDGSMT